MSNSTIQLITTSCNPIISGTRVVDSRLLDRIKRCTNVVSLSREHDTYALYFSFKGMWVHRHLQSYLLCSHLTEVQYLKIERETRTNTSPDSHCISPSLYKVQPSDSGKGSFQVWSEPIETFLSLDSPSRSWLCWTLSSSRSRLSPIPPDLHIDCYSPICQTHLLDPASNTRIP